MAHHEALEGLDPFDLMDAESERLATFFSSLDDRGWTLPTACEGWRRREIVSHLAGGETYNLACLDETLPELFSQASEAGAVGLDGFNDWHVRLRADRAADEVLGEWRAKNAEVRRRMRELGPDGEIQTSVGQYPVHLQAFHLASEYATHADDMDVPVPSGELDGRIAWRARVSHFAVDEKAKGVRIEARDGRYLVRAGGAEAELAADEFVSAVSARLPDDHPLDARLREALRALA